MAGSTFFEKEHCKYVLGLSSKTESFEHAATEHLRMSGIYWGLSSMALLGRDQEMNPEEIINWVLKCQLPCGGFGGNIGHDAHILYTLSAIQILAILNALHRIDSEAVAQYFVSLQQADGSFIGDCWGEVDTRFSYCALAGLSIVGKLTSGIDVDKAAKFVASCQNFDGGFGCIPGAEVTCQPIFAGKIVADLSFPMSSLMPGRYFVAWVPYRSASGSICWTQSF